MKHPVEKRKIISLLVILVLLYGFGAIFILFESEILSTSDPIYSFLDLSAQHYELHYWYIGVLFIILALIISIKGFLDLKNRHKYHK